MIQKVNDEDEVEQTRLTLLQEQLAKQSAFSRLLYYSRPRINIFIGLLVSILQGALMPIFGGVMAKMLFVLMDVRDYEEMRRQANFWCLLMLIFAVCAFVTGFLQKFSFGVIGENITQNVRNALYRNVMQKHLGWFDDRDNAPGVLTSTLSSDA
jgi:ATP-binding cassette subfamily B (MDR/TAP) protein 1